MSDVAPDAPASAQTRGRCTSRMAAPDALKPRASFMVGMSRQIQSMRQRLQSALAADASPVADSDVAVERQAESAAANPATSIWSAIKAGDVGAVSRLLDASPEMADARGAVGETPLHFAYLLNSPAHRLIARELLRRKPSLVADVYEGRNYHGENVLHMAVANGDLEEARFLVNLHPALVDGCADGEFFAPDGSAYYGGSPLGFAVCTNQPAIVSFLVRECGAEISWRDGFGNSAVHLCVFWDRMEMLELLDALWTAGHGRPPLHAHTPLAALRNGDGLTPIVLAASLGRTDTFVRLWERSRVQEWCWGSIAARSYPLDFIDDIAQITCRHNAASKGIAAATDNAAQVELCVAMGVGPYAAIAAPPGPGGRERKLPTGTMPPAGEDLEFQRIPTALEQVRGTRFAAALLIRIVTDALPHPAGGSKWPPRHLDGPPCPAAAGQEVVAFRISILPPPLRTHPRLPTHLHGHHCHAV